MRGGTITNTLDVGDFASASIRAGSVAQFVYLFDAASVRIGGGTVGGSLSTNGALVSAIWSGGTVGEDVIADGGSSLLVQGSGFAVDGTLVPYGPLPPQTGLVCGAHVLTGTLASGEPLTNAFGHDGCFDPGLARELTGTIVVPEPGPAAAGHSLLAALVALVRWRGGFRPGPACGRAPGPRARSGRTARRTSRRRA